MRPYRRTQFSQQLPVMLLCRCQRPFPSAVLYVGEECGMGFAVALEPYKIPVIVLGRLVNPADARSSCGILHISVSKGFE
jgi:hypothetical protein